jgi:flagellar FliJ protein
MRLAILEAEGEAEADFFAQEAATGMYRAGFFEGLKVRKAKIQSEIDVILIEETGAREALAEAFETQKKYEHIAQNLQVEARKVQGRRDSAALDELGLRRKAS